MHTHTYTHTGEEDDDEDEFLDPLKKRYSALAAQEDGAKPLTAEERAWGRQWTPMQASILKSAVYSALYIVCVQWRSVLRMCDVWYVDADVADYAAVDAGAPARATAGLL
jgi:hypothetical protein